MARGVRKAAVDSTSALVSAGKNTSVYQWPEEVTSVADEEQRRRVENVFSGILATRENFTSPQLAIAARYAILTIECDKTLSKLVELGWLTKKEGRGGKEIVAQSPLAQIFQMQQGEIVRMSTKLGLNYLDGDPQTIRNHANLSGGARLALQESDGAPDWVAESKKIKKGKT